MRSTWTTLSSFLVAFASCGLPVAARSAPSCQSPTIRFDVDPIDAEYILETRGVNEDEVMP